MLANTAAAAFRLFAGPSWLERRLGPAVARHGVDRVALAYPGWPRRDLLELLKETRSAYSNEYEPFTDFRPIPSHGRFVNVSPQGFRSGPRQQPWPPDPAVVNVFLFGGSTTFGIGLPDWQTISSYLGDRLAMAPDGRPVHVYNLARPAYYSRQERVLFERLVGQGVEPDVAVFIDGLNELYIWPQPLSSDVMHHALSATVTPSPPPTLASVLAATPLGRLGLSLREPSRPARPGKDASGAEPPSPERIVTDWLANQRLVEAAARSFGIRTLFVWQPIPCYGYDLRHHLFFGDWAVSHLRPERMKRTYEIFAERRPRSGGENAVLWLADIQADRRENLYVDELHYSAVLTDEIASRIARELLERGWLAPRTPPSRAEARTASQAR